MTHIHAGRAPFLAFARSFQSVHTDPRFDAVA